MADGTAGKGIDVLPAIRAEWPALKVTDQDFTSQIAELETEDSAEVSPETARDVFLALACATGDSGAISIFETLYFGSIAGVIARMKLSPDVGDEVRQIVRERLFLPKEGKPPAILRYAGRGNLGALVKTAATRSALNLIRGNQRRESLHGEFEAAASAQDPMLSFLKDEHRKDFKQAFEAAVATLEVRQRNLLRLALLNKLSIDKISAVYQVHRSTAARWLQSARETVSSKTREILASKLNVDSTELDRLYEIVESQLELSVSRILKSDEPSGEH